MICGGCGGPLFKRECLGYCRKAKARKRRQRVAYVEWRPQFHNERGEPLRVAIWRMVKRAA